MQAMFQRRAERRGGKIARASRREEEVMAEPLTVQLQGVLDRLAAGDPRAKDELVTMAERRLMVLARKLLRGFQPGLEETAGVVAEAYLKLHTSLEEVRPATVRQFFGLASLQMRRVLLDLARATGRRGKRTSINETDAGFEPEDPAPGESHHDLVADLFAAVDRLDPELRDVVDLLFFQGLSQAEAGQVLGIHEDTVKRKWARARVALARFLGAFHPDGG